MPSRRLLLMNAKKRIVLIAHDNRKHDLLDWARCNRGLLVHHDLFATGTTGSILSSELGFDITRLPADPLVGTNRSARRSSKAELISSFSSRILWSRIHTTWT